MTLLCLLCLCVHSINTENYNIILIEDIHLKNSYKWWKCNCYNVIHLIKLGVQIMRFQIWGNNVENMIFHERNVIENVIIGSLSSDLFQRWETTENATICYSVIVYRVCILTLSILNIIREKLWLLLSIQTVNY